MILVNLGKRPLLHLIRRSEDATRKGLPVRTLSAAEIVGQPLVACDSDKERPPTTPDAFCPKSWAGGASRAGA